MNTNRPTSRPADQWEDSAEEIWPSYSKQDIEALKALNPRLFTNSRSWYVILMQIGITLVLSFFFFIFVGSPDNSVYTYSALVGGSIGFLPSTLFLLRLELAKASNKNKSAGTYLSALVSGELLKIVLTVLLFIAFAIKLPDLKWVPLLVAYVVTLKCYLLAWFWK
ncbi:ATP synthase subunit I [Polynucleobacter antarcticus]|uniref:ATP synthase subunit I n=1 Tax=Polynucleobacter antarcticus TaxID=1743162 RepID=UPI00156FA88D|nr:ATP synthase subunit I [Polynucleobacter antarcticus]